MTMQRYKILAIGLLAYATALLINVANDPRATTLKDWQPLIASVLALMGAGLVYQSAMAKVNFDREVHQAEYRRKTRGLYLRLSFACIIIEHDANRHYETFKNDSTSGMGDLSVEVVTLRSTSAVDEAWQSLDFFPGSVAERLGSLRISLVNLETLIKQIGPTPFFPGKFAPAGTPLSELRKVLQVIRKDSGHLRTELDQMVNAL